MALRVVLLGLCSGSVGDRGRLRNDLGLERRRRRSSLHRQLVQKMGLIIYVSLLLLTPKILSLLFDPQDNVFLSWAHSYAAFHNWSNCWVCGVLPYSSVEGFPWWTSSLQGKDFLQVCEYLQQQSHAMPLLHLMTSTNPKMDWCNTLYFNYGHNVTFNFDFNLF